MNFTILTLFPDFINQGSHTSILGKASEKGLLSFDAVNIRDYSTDKNNRVDDYTYGGGAGMLIQAQPVFDAYNDVCSKLDKKPRTIYVTPQGKPFTQIVANELSREDNLIFICGHYEGIDERVLDEIVTDRYSLGDYVLTGGELPALVMMDAISRLVPGVLGNDTSAEVESFYGNLLEYPQYTRPEVWNGKAVPEVLLKGNPKDVDKWRREKSEELTKTVRPDLYSKYELREKYIELLKKDKRNNIHMIEALSRGIGEIINENPLVIYLPSCGISCLYEADVDTDALKSILPDNSHIIIVPEKLGEQLVTDLGLGDPCIINNAVYTEKVHKKIKNKDIRLLDMSYAEYVAERYSHDSLDYIKSRIERELLYGAFVDGKIVGFIGKHCEGSIGMLYVDDAYRRMGIAMDLENFMINKGLEEGQTPFGQVIIGNDASYSLQLKNGLYMGDKKWYWLEIDN